jgi:hypothetical protein
MTSPRGLQNLELGRRGAADAELVSTTQTHGPRLGVLRVGGVEEKRQRVETHGPQRAMT